MADIDISAVDALIYQQASSVGAREMSDDEKQATLDLIALLTGGEGIPPSLMEGIEQKISQASEAQALGTLTPPVDGEPWNLPEATDLETKSAKQDPWNEVDALILEARTLGDRWNDGRAAVGGSVGGMFSGALGALDALASSKPIHPSYMFHVMLGANPLGDFQAVDGLGKQHEPFEYYEGGKNDAPHLMFGSQPKYTDITLKWGLMYNPEMWYWLSGLGEGQRMKRNCTIMHLDRDRVPLRVYFLTGCMPTAWSAPPLSTSDSNVSLESITIRAQNLYVFPNLFR
jgi:phage tail-like protein